MEPVEQRAVEAPPPVPAEPPLHIKRSENSLLKQYIFSYLDPLFQKGVRVPLELVRIASPIIALTQYDSLGRLRRARGYRALCSHRKGCIRRLER